MSIRIPIPTPRLGSALLLAAAVLGSISCQRPAGSSEATMQPTFVTNPDPLLVAQVRISSRHGGTSGYRILSDGRYESLLAPAKAPERWQPLRQLDEAELATFRATMDGLELALLEPLYEPEQPVMDGGSTTWLLRVEGGVIEVKVRKGASVPALDSLYAALPPAVVEEAFTTEWTIPGPDGEQTWPLPCDTSEVADIDAITWILATGEARESGDPGPGATRLMVMTWKQGDAVSSRHEVWSDGWQMVSGESGVTSRKHHAEADLARLRELLAAVPWHDLASLCP